MAKNRWIDVNVRRLKTNKRKQEKYLEVYYENCIAADPQDADSYRDRTEANKKKLLAAICSIDSEKQQEVLLLRTYYNMPFHKITRLLKTGNINTSLARYRRGVVKVKKSMEAIINY